MKAGLLISSLLLSGVAFAQDNEPTQEKLATRYKVEIGKTTRLGLRFKQGLFPKEIERRPPASVRFVGGGTSQTLPSVIYTYEHTPKHSTSFILGKTEKGYRLVRIVENRHVL